MRDRGYVLDYGNFEADGLHGADCRLTTGAGPLDANLDFLESMTHSLTAGVLGNHLGGIGRALTRSLEAHLAGTGPSKNGTAHVGDADDGVVESGLNVCDPMGDVLATLGLDDLGWLDRVVEIETDGGGRCGLFNFLLLALFHLGLLSLGGSSGLGGGHWSGLGGSNSLSGGYWSGLGRMMSFGLFATGGVLGEAFGFFVFFGHELDDVLLSAMGVKLILSPDDADGLTGPFASAGIGLGALTTDWKSTPMAYATVAVDRLQAL